MSRPPISSPQLAANNRVELTSGPAGADPSTAHAERSGGPPSPATQLRVSILNQTFDEDIS